MIHNFNIHEIVKRYQNETRDLRLKILLNIIENSTVRTIKDTLKAFKNFIKRKPKKNIRPFLENIHIHYKHIPKPKQYAGSTLPIIKKTQTSYGLKNI